MRPLWKPVAACLAGLALAAPAAADEKDRYKEFFKQQREQKKRLWERQKKQQEWQREQQKRQEERYRDQARREEEWAREERKRQREAERDGRKRAEEQFREQNEFGRGSGAFGGYPGVAYATPDGRSGHAQNGSPLGAGGYSGVLPDYSATRPLYPSDAGPGHSSPYSGYAGQFHITPAQPAIPAPQQSSVDGVWYFRGDPTKPCSVQTVAAPSGPYLVFTNENGTPAAGQVSGDGRRVTIPDWNLTGTVSGNALVWPNGDFWSR